ncbi:hypothetical protein ARZXY2_3322 [Arthrobacter sp. ZXY-2]|nr:hypothetical protein ARZXY2_3322 [Arthrobacter sp. ZXY-2]
MFAGILPAFAGILPASSWKLIHGPSPQTGLTLFPLIP